MPLSFRGSSNCRCLLSTDILELSPCEYQGRLCIPVLFLLLKTGEMATSFSNSKLPANSSRKLSMSILSVKAKLSTCHRPGQDSGTPCVSALKGCASRFLITECSPGLPARQQPLHWESVSCFTSDKNHTTQRLLIPIVLNDNILLIFLAPTESSAEHTKLGGIQSSHLVDFLFFSHFILQCKGNDLCKVS